MSAASRETRPSARRWFVRDFALPIFIIVMAGGVGFIEPRFFLLENIVNLSRQIVPLLVVSVGQAFAIISGGLDLSIAAVLSLAGVLGVLTMLKFGIAAGIATMLLTGLGAGLFSGFVIAYLGTTPLIVTLGALSIAQAFALILANGVPIYSIPAAYGDAVGFGAVWGVPVTVWIGVLTVILGYVILRHTVLGRYIYAIGSNVSAADKSGVDVRRYTMLVYMISGFTSAVGAVVLTAWVGAAQPIAAPDITLQSLAAVVLGGVALTGGSGGMPQVLYGVIILGMLSNAMNMVGISAYYQTLVIGIVIILAVILDRLRRRSAA